MRKSAILILTGWTLAIVLACSSISPPPQNPVLPTSPTGGAGGNSGIAKAVAPNNELLAYVEFSNKRNDVHLIDPTKTESDSCLSCQSSGSLITSDHAWIAWSPDHTKIAYLATHEETGKFPADLYVADVDGSTRLVRTWDILEASGKYILTISPLEWSPDGRRVLVMFGSGIEDMAAYGLHIVDVASGDEKQVRVPAESPVWYDDTTIVTIINSYWQGYDTKGSSRTL